MVPGEDAIGEQLSKAVMTKLGNPGTSELFECGNDSCDGLLWMNGDWNCDPNDCDDVIRRIPGLGEVQCMTDCTIEFPSSTLGI